MDSKHRVMAALRHQRPDRIPTFDSFWEDFSARCSRELNLPEDMNPEDYFDIDIGIAIADETPFPTQRKILKQDGDWQIERDGWDALSKRRRGRIFTASWKRQCLA